jgi:hypothetical protein
MDETEQTPAETPAAEHGGALVSAAKAIGKAAGKVSSIAGGGDSKSHSGGSSKKKPAMKQKENIYQAEYLGSGTFRISKPKRRKTKRRQSSLKNPQRGARKF